MKRFLNARSCKPIERRMQAGVLTFMALLFTGTACPTNYSGPVLAVRSAASTTTPGYIRVGVHINGATGCANNGWFSFELPDTSATAKMWAATLLAALHTGRDVGIGGTGQCDAHSIETIYFIDGL